MGETQENNTKRGQSKDREENRGKYIYFFVNRNMVLYFYLRGDTGQGQHKIIKKAHLVASPLTGPREVAKRQ